MSLLDNIGNIVNERINDFVNDKIKVYAFVGPSRNGKKLSCADGGKL